MNHRFRFDVNYAVWLWLRYHSIPAIADELGVTVGPVLLALDRVGEMHKMGNRYSGAFGGYCRTHKQLWNTLLQNPWRGNAKHKLQAQITWPVQ